MANWTGKKSSVMFTKPDEPSFLKKFKEKVGYKEDKGVMEKFETMPKATDEDLEDNDDELPQVVQLGPDDLSQEDYDAMMEKENPDSRKKEEKIESSEGGKILFKPTGKRGHDNDLKASTKKTKNEDKEERHDEEKEDRHDEEKEKKAKKKEKSNKTLLSFEDEDGEDST